MAVSDVQIAKLALQHLGDRYDITSLSQATTEAEQINLVYENVRDALVRDHPWKFALRYMSPSNLIGTPPAQWTYMYTYPPEALKVLRIINPLDPSNDALPPIKWTVARNSLDVKVLLTDESAPEFEYIQRVTDPARFDDHFVLAFSWLLAQHIAMPITGDEGIAQSMEAAATRMVEKAKMEDGNEGINREQSRDPDWIRARL